MTEIEKLEALTIGQNLQKDIQAFNGDVVSLDLLNRHIQNDNQVGMLLELISLNRVSHP
jgi:hypothetical protein